LQGILDCANASIDHFDENREAWMDIRNTCECLLTAEDLYRYQALHDGSDDENRQSKWSELLQKFDPDDEDIRSSDNEGQANLRDDLEIDSKVMREKTIAYHQLKAFSLYLEDKLNLTAAYHKFLVSCVYFLWCLHVLQ
jgi:hypothetical protein